MKLIQSTVALLVAAIGFGQSSIKWPNVNQDQRNYTGNIQATDRAYVTGNINQKKHPAIEFPATPAVTHAAYVRGSTVSLQVGWSNDNTFPLAGTLTWTGARLAVPNTSGGTDYISLSYNSSGQSIWLDAYGGYD